MSFADWKKRSKLFCDVTVRCMPARFDIERACQAAYKAGERDGRQQAESVAEKAINLRDIVRAA